MKTLIPTTPMKLIKTTADHGKALARLEALMHLDPAPGTVDAEELELLAFLVESYEKAHFPILPPDPVEAIRFRMEQQGLSRVDMEPFIGSKSKVSEVLSGTRPLSLTMIRKLNQGLGIPADVLLRQPGQSLPKEIPVDDYPVKEMFEREWFEGFRGKWQDVKQHAEDMLQQFFARNGCDSIPALNRQQIRSNATTDDKALQAWRCRVLELGMKKKLPPFDPASCTPEFIKSLTTLSRFDEGPQLAARALEEHGIGVVIEPRLPKTHLDGAALMLPNGHPVIAVTIRQNRLDNLWFTLFHELGHVLRHLGSRSDFFDLDIDKAKSDKLEKEADLFALDAFFSSADWRTLRHLHTAPEIRSEAKRRSIHPAIIAGRLRREAGDYTRHSTLVGQGAARAAFGFNEDAWPAR